METEIIKLSAVIVNTHFQLISRGFCGCFRFGFSPFSKTNTFLLFSGD